VYLLYCGVLNAGVNDITYPMLVAAVLAIANHTKPVDLIPNPLDPTVHQIVARAVE
jgi:malate dehydrogenase (oxaloacetate-decarboxylating)